MIILTPEQKQALNTKRHTVVTANAGSGKTLVLTHRFLETILHENINYNQIVAITFTEKAASELQNKIAAAIDLKLKEPIYKNNRRLINFRNYLHSAKISTIHSFCSDLIKLYPVNAGIDPQFRVIEDFEKDEFIEKAIEETFLESIEDELTRDLLRIFGKSKLINQITSMINSRYQTDLMIKRFYERSSNEREDFENYLMKIRDIYYKYFFIYKIDFINELLENLENSKNDLSGKSIKEKTDLIDQSCSELKSAISNKDGIKFFRILNNVSNQLLTKRDLKPRRDFKDASSNSAIYKFSEKVKTLQKFFDENLLDESNEFLKWKLTLDLIELYKKSKEKFELYKANEGALDFNDLLIVADKLLENKIIQSEVSKRYKFILIDEFQDTDSIQYNIIKKITNDFDHEHNVFIVGDEKQSIYAFRNAKLNIFQEARKVIRSRNELQTSNINEADIVLHENYRSTPSIAAFVNKIFEDFSSVELPENDYDEKFIYKSLYVGRANFIDHPIEIILFNEENENQAEKVAKRILSLVNQLEIFDKKLNVQRKADFKDFTILFRERNDIKEFEKAFLKFNIPFTLTRGKGYFQSEELTDWQNYFRFLSNPLNDDALIAILRSPFYALSDNEILQIALHQNESNVKLSFFDKLLNLSYTDCSESIKFAAEKLKDHLNFACKYSIPTLIHKILDDTNYFGSIEYVKERKAQIISNVNKLIDFAQQFESSGLNDFKSFADYLYYAYEEIEEVAEATVSGVSNSVKFMTIHQAKGLDFPIVILPNFHKPLKKYSLNFGELGTEDETGIIFKLTDGENNFHTLSSAIGTHIREQKSYNENLRVLYVALTRASELLILTFEDSEYKFNADEINALEKLNNKRNEKTINRSKGLSYQKFILNKLGNLQLKPGQVVINSVLTFSTEKENKITREIKDYKLKINIIGKVNEQNDIRHSDKEDDAKESKVQIFIDEIKSQIHDDIITATQLNAFAQCPRKYFLKYVIGYNPKKLFSQEDSYDEELLTGLEIGKIYHEIFERLETLRIEEVEQILSDILSSFPENERNEIYRIVRSKLRELLQNELFKEIFSVQNNLREFEISLKFENQILLGIIDRINIHENKITIIDYKSDTVLPDRENEKISEYLGQMEFYILLVSKYFHNVDSIELILFFINLPEKSFCKAFSKEEIKSIELKFRDLLESLEASNFEKNLNHCHKCEYFNQNDCIL